MFAIDERVRITPAHSARLQVRAIPGTVIAVSSVSTGLGTKPRQLVTVKWDVDDKLPMRFLSTNLQKIRE